MVTIDFAHADGRAVEGIIVSSTGTILVSRPDVTKRPYRLFTAGDVTEWTMLKSDGRVLARVQLPNSFSPKVFHGCSLYGFDEDEDGIPLMVKYELGVNGC